MTGIRLQLMLAKAGVASRRHAEGLITAGEVAVNGKVVTELGTRVDPVRDHVTVRGNPVHQEEPAYFLLYKPAGYVTTASDPEGRQTVFSLLPEGAPAVRLFSVGRLDYNTEGALLLTNDGELAHELMHPSKGVPKIYHAKFRGPVTREQLGRLRAGVELPPIRIVAPRGTEGPLPPPRERDRPRREPLTLERSAPADVNVIGETGKHTWLEITLHEGKNRQIHRMAEAVGSSLLKLLRVQYANLSIEGLKLGQCRAVLQTEVNELRRAVGLKARSLPPSRSPAPMRDRERGRARPARTERPPSRSRPDRTQRPTAPRRPVSAEARSEGPTRVVGRPTFKPLDQAIDRPLGRPTGRPLGRPTGRPLGKPTGRPTGRPPGRAQGRPTTRPPADAPVRPRSPRPSSPRPRRP